MPTFLRHPEDKPPSPVPIRSQSASKLLLANEIAVACFYVDASRAPATHHAYATDWKRFSDWCVTRSADCLPAEPATVAVYLSGLAARGLAPPTVARALAAITQAHRRVNLPAPHRVVDGAVILDMLAGIRRTHAAPPDRKDAADADIVARLLASIEGDRLAALRDRALIAFGMALAARRSELVGLDVADLAWEARGVRVMIRRSKTDQEGAGAIVAVPEGSRLRPLDHLRAWLAAANIVEGPVFRPLWRGGRIRAARLSGHAVARIIQVRAAGCGLDPTRYAGHSLRAGFVTAAAASGADIWRISQVSRHRSVQVLATYVRDQRLFDNHAGERFL